MKRIIVFLVLLCVELTASVLFAAGVAYVVRSPSTGLYLHPNASEPTHTLIKDQIVTVLQHRGDWYMIITADGDEGWVRESALAALPAGEEESMIDETAPDEAQETIYYDFVVGGNKGNIRAAPNLNAAVVRTAKAGEVLTVVVESDKWCQVATEGKVEGWIHKSTGNMRESKNLSLRLLEFVEGKLIWFDQVKNENSYFRRTGQFPSFFLRHSEEDIVVERSSTAKSVATIHLYYALRDIEYRMVVDGAESFILPAANRVFFADLLLSAFDLFPEISGLGIYFWSAFLEESGSLSWRSRGEVILSAEKAQEILREGDGTARVWDLLEKNTLAPEMWKRGEKDGATLPF